MFFQLLCSHPSNNIQHDDNSVDEVIEERMTNGHGEHNRTAHPDYDDDVMDDSHEYATPQRNEFWMRYDDFRSGTTAGNTEPLSLVINKSAGLVVVPGLRPRTPDEDDDDSYLYDRPPRNADSAPPSFASLS